MIYVMPRRGHTVLHGLPFHTGNTAREMLLPAALSSLRVFDDGRYY